MDKNTKINIVLLVLISVLSAAAVYASYIEAHITGPSSITATSKGNVILALPDRLISFNADGTIKQQKEFNQLGISGPVEDMQQISSGQIIIGDGGQRILLSCDESLTHCRKLNDTTNHYDIGQFHKFYIDEPLNRILLVNTEKHELVSLDLKGNLTKTLIDKTDKLQFPSGLYYLGDNQLMITSSLNYHIYQYDISDDKAKKTRLVNIDAVARFNQKYLPINLSRTDNQHWWVVAKSNQLVGSSLLEFDKNWDFQRVIGSNDITHPYDILSLGKWMLVTDLYGIDLQAFNQQGELLSKFGESEFYSSLQNSRNTKQIAAISKQSSIGVILIVLVIALVLERIRKKHEKQQQASENISHSTEDNHNQPFEIHPKSIYLKLIRIAPVILLILLFIPLIFLWDSSPETLKVMLIGFVPMIIIIGTVVTIAARHFPKKIRVENNTLTITNYKNKEVSMQIQDVVYTNMIIWMGNNYYSLGNNGALIEINENRYRLFNFLEQAKKEKKGKLLVKTILADKWFYLALIVSFVITQHLDDLKPDSEILENETEIINELHSTHKRDNCDNQRALVSANSRRKHQNTFI